MLNDRDKALEQAGIDYQAGLGSVNALAVKYDIPEPTLRRHFKKLGLVKGASDAKRELVKEALAGQPLTNDEGVTNDLTNAQNDEVLRQVQLEEATQDVKDMNDGLAVARKCINKLLLMVDAVEHPKEVKYIIDANKAAVETIRKIRALDDVPPPPETEVTVQMDDGFAELRAAFRRRLERESAEHDPAAPA